MAVEHAANTYIMWGPVFFSQQSSEFDAPFTTASVETTTHGNASFVSRIPTTTDRVGNVTAFANLAQQDFLLYTGGTSYLTMYHTTPVEGLIGHSFNSVRGNYNFGGSVGQALQVTADFKATYPVLRGKCLYHQTVTSTENGAGLNFGAVAAGSTAYFILHVDYYTITGTTPTLDVTIERDIDNTWASPVTVATFTQVGDSTDTTNSFQSKTLAGAQTETWYRAVATLGGTTPSYTVNVFIGQI